MPRLDLWRTAPTTIGAFNLSQIVSTAGDGDLRDDSACAFELRQHLREVSAEALGDYIERCPSQAQQKGGYNTVEGFFLIFKRGMRGIYQHRGEKHLHRYCAEFSFCYTLRAATGCDDRQRATEGLKGMVGKRLTYRRLDLLAGS